MRIISRCISSWSRIRSSGGSARIRSIRFRCSSRISSRSRRRSSAATACPSRVVSSKRSSLHAVAPRHRPAAIGTALQSFIVIAPSVLEALMSHTPGNGYARVGGSDRYAGQAAAIHADVRGRAAATHGEARARPESLRALAFVAGPESIRRRSVFRDWGYVTPEEGPITGRDPDRPAGAGIGSEEEKGSDAERAIRGRGAARGIHRRRAAEPGALAADVPARRGAGGDRRAAEEAAVAEVPAGPPGGLV